jgi:P27 family predicted phage terminase small subunit
MANGRPPKPTSLKLLHGDRADRINFTEPLPSEAAVQPPVELSPGAQAVWDRLAPDMTAKQVLTAWDLDNFAAFCDATDLYWQARKHLEVEGMTAQGAAGGVIKNPHWQIMRDAVSVMSKLGGSYGLTPADRTRLTIGGKEDEGKGAGRLLG